MAGAGRAAVRLPEVAQVPGVAAMAAPQTGLTTTLGPQTGRGTVRWQGGAGLGGFLQDGHPVHNAAAQGVVTGGASSLHCLARLQSGPVLEETAGAGGDTATTALRAGWQELLVLSTLGLTPRLRQQPLSLAVSEAAGVNLAEVQASPRVANLLLMKIFGYFSGILLCVVSRVLGTEGGAVPDMQGGDVSLFFPTLTSHSI